MTDIIHLWISDLEPRMPLSIYTLNSDIGKFYHQKGYRPILSMNKQTFNTIDFIINNELINETKDKDTSRGIVSYYDGYDILIHDDVPYGKVVLR